jgi:hypothetical protein
MLEFVHHWMTEVWIMTDWVRIDCDFPHDPFRTWTLMDGCYIYSPYSEGLVAVIRKVMGRRWVADKKCWKIPSDLSGWPSSY